MYFLTQQKNTVLKLHLIAFLIFVSLFILKSSFASAATNPKINYQGKLTTSAGVAVANGTYNMRFWLLTTPSIATTSAIWTESLTATNKVQVTNGLFSVMLGSSTSLTGVNFNQTLYLGVEIGGSAGPVWDGEMSPRKVIGTVPAAFEARKLGGVASSSFLRSDIADIKTASSSSSLLTVTQTGIGNILDLFSGVTKVFTVRSNGNVGIGSTTPSAKLTVAGTSYFGGNVTATGTVKFSALTALRALFTDAQSRATTTALSASLSNSLTDETGTNRLVFSASPAFSGTATFSNITGSSSASFASTTLTGRTKLINATSTTLTITGKLFDNSSSAGAVGSILKSTGTGFVWTATSTLGLLSTSSINTSLKLSALITDETGSGSLVFGTSPTLSSTTINGILKLGGQTASRALFTDAQSRATTTALSATLLNSLTDETGSGVVVFGTSPTISGATLNGFSNIANASTTNLTLRGKVFDSTNNTGTKGMVLLTSGTSTRWVATSTLGLAGGSSLFTDGGATTYITSTADNFAIGTTTSNQALFIFRNGADAAIGFGTIAGANEKWTIGIDDSDGAKFKISSSSVLGTNDRLVIDGAGRVGIGTTTPSAKLHITGTAGSGDIFAISSSTNARLFTVKSTGQVGIGSSSPQSLLTIDKNSGLTGSIVGGIKERLTFNNTTLSAVYYGDNAYIVNAPTATSTLVGKIIRIEDNGTLGNVVRGLEVQAHRGTNTKGENTGISGFGRTFGVRGTTEADAGNTYEPAGLYGETRGTIQGNAIRGYSGTVTSADLFNLYQDTSVFTGTGLSMNFGNSGGSFSSSSSKFINLKNAGISKFVVLSTGATGIGSSTPASKLVVVGTGGSTQDIFSVASSTGTKLLTVKSTGNVGIGTTTPAYKLTVVGDTRITGKLYDSANGGGSNGMVLKATATGFQWVATSTLGLGGSSFSNSAQLAALLSDETGTGRSVFSNNPAFSGTATFSALTATGTLTVANNINISDTTKGYQLGGNRILYASSTNFSTLVGDSAGASLFAGGTDNVALGYRALAQTTSGDDNVAIGSYALNSNITGGGNIGIGGAALATNNNGVNNIGIGLGAGDSIWLNGNNNILLGFFAGENITDGDNNIIIGHDIDAVSATANNRLNIGNLLFGTGLDGTSTTLSSGNIGIGTSTPSAKLQITGTAGSGDIFAISSSTNTRLLTVKSNGTVGIGTTTPAYKLTVVGDTRITGKLYDSANGGGTNGFVLKSTATGQRWVATSTLGFSSSFTTSAQLAALLSDETGTGRSVFSNSPAFSGTATFSALTATGTLTVANNINISDTARGYQLGGTRILYASSTNFSTLVGYNSGTALRSSALWNTAVGYNALATATSSTENTAIGVSALSANRGGVQNTAVGVNALTVNKSGSYNTANGYYSLSSNLSGVQNTGSGIYSLQYNTTGSNNTSNGAYALQSSSIGSGNTAIGASTLGSNITGSNNTALGFGSGGSINSATGTGANTLIGYGTGGGITTGINNTILGANVTGLASGLSNNIILADGAGNQRINVGSTGNVGIGTTTPSAKIHITGTAGSGDIFAISSSTNSRLLTVKSSGSVGIGTSSPKANAKLAINGNVYLEGANRTMNFGTLFPAGPTGYGLRENGGMIEFRNVYASSTALASGWTPISSVASVKYQLNEKGWVNTGATLPAVRRNAHSLIIGDYVYLFGGIDAGSPVNTIYRAPVSNPLAWVDTGSTLPGTLYGGQAMIVGDFVYLFGGSSNVIYRAPVSNPLAWVNTGSTLPASTASAQSAIVGDFIYLFGGDSTNAILRAPVSNPLAWVTTGSTLPGNLTLSQLAVLGDYIYLFGGDTANGGAATNVIYRAPVSNPLAWKNTGVTMPTNINRSAIAVIGDYVYLFGGYDGSSFLSSIYRAPISSPTSWVITGATLPSAMSISEAVIVGDNIYFFGGYTGASTNLIYRAPVTSSTQQNKNLFARLNAPVGPWFTLSSSTNAISFLGANGATSSGRVGIGTTTPSAKLTILATANSTQDIFSVASSTNSKFLIIKSNGTVGIGTTTPAYKLTVVGDTRITGKLYDSANGGGTNGMVLKATATGFQWVATSTLGFSSSFTTSAQLAALLSDETGTGRSVFSNNPAFSGTATFSALTATGTLTVANNINISDTTKGYQLGGNRILYASSTNFSTLVGDGAGRLVNSTGLYNTAVGYQSLYTATSSNYNTAVGYQTLYANRGGTQNNANGYRSLYSNTTGAGNNTLGYQSLYFNTTGAGNSAIGTQALYFNTTGLFNSANGYTALYSNTTGSYNIANGGNSLNSNTIGSNNTALGHQSLFSNITGSNNTALGYQSGFDINTATSTGANTIIGYNTGRGITTGINNTILGANVTGLAAGLSNNIIIADGAGNQRINVGSTGNVGIGTTTPTSKLTIQTDSTQLRLQTASNPISYYTTLSSNFNSSNPFILNVSGQKILQSKQLVSVTSAETVLSNFYGLSFATGAIDPALSDIRMVVTQAGNVGIGSSTPSSKLAAVGTAGSLNDIFSVASSTNTKLFTVKSTGLVGIGTSTPRSGLDLVGSTANKNTFTIGNVAQGGYLAFGSNSAITNGIQYGASELGLYTNQSSGMRFYTNTGVDTVNPELTITNGGNVGVGTTTPAYKLTVVGDTRITGKLYDSANGGGTNGMVLKATATGFQWVATSTLGFSSSFTTSAQLAALLSDETGTGRSVFSNNPAFSGTATFSALTATGTLTVANNINISDTTKGYQLGGNRILYASSTNFSTLVGNGAGRLLNSTGLYNTALGYQSLYIATSSDYNTAVGFQSLYFNRGGFQNTASGFLSLYFNTTGSNNTVSGSQSLYFNTTGSNNTVSGSQSLYFNTTGSNNTANGVFSLYSNTTGSSNTANGVSSLYSNTTGSYNTAFGHQAGYDINTATSTGANTIIGYNTGRGITIGTNNTILGAGVTGLASTTSNNIILADGAGNQRINVGSTGNVGIGTTTPNSKLTLVGTAGSTQDIFAVASSTNTKLFTIKSTGQVGIGTSSPNQLLSIVASKATPDAKIVLQSFGPTNFTGIQILDHRGTLAGSVTYGGYTAGSITNQLAIAGRGATTTLGFYTSPSSVLTEQMRLTTSGNLGIGTTTPSAKLHITGTAGSGDIFAISSSTNARLFTVKSSGRVGIGTTSPRDLLALGTGNLFIGRASASTTGNIYLGGHTDSSQAGMRLFKGGSGFTGSYIDVVGTSTLDGLHLRVDSGIGSTDRLNILTGGNIGIGSSTPLSAKLALVGTAGSLNDIFTVASSTGTRLFSVKSTGNVSIGTTTATSYKLTVAAFAATGYVARIANTNTGQNADGLLISLSVTNANRAAGNYFIGFSQGDGTVAGKIQGGASAVAYTTTAADLAEYFPVDDADHMPKPGEIVSLDQVHDRAVVVTAGDMVPFGIVTTNPGFIGNGPICKAKDIHCDENYAKDNALISLTGQVPLKVSNENGTIKAGDSITISSIAGVGMKAHFGDTAVGYALQTTDGTEATSTVMVFANVHTAFGMNPDPALLASTTNATAFTGKTIMQRIVQLAEGFVDGVLHVTGIKTDKLCVGNTCVNEAQLIHVLDVINNGQSYTPPAGGSTGTGTGTGGGGGSTGTTTSNGTGGSGDGGGSTGTTTASGAGGQSGGTGTPPPTEPPPEPVP